MRKSIRPILRSRNLGHYKISLLHPFLQPELLYVEVSDLPNSLPHENTSGGGGICSQFEVGIIPEVLSDTLGAEALSSSL